MKVFHLGMKGAISNNLFWQSITSFSRNYGTHSSPYQIPTELFSYLLKLNYQHKNKPLEFILYMAGDLGNKIKHHVGIGVGIRYQFTY